MRLLLDTHIWLWHAHGSKRLGHRLRRELANPRNELWLSPVSVWECLALNAKGRIRIEGSLSAWVPRATAPFREAPLTHEIVLAAFHLPTAHPDPADRFLAATAEVLDLTLATADANLLGLGTIKTLGNR
ncbi:MAG TPA: type II toxin-antitoxin system VapC family toxin [Terriglobia bacterium]|nr:type II toxin-antitoxin system VapC family toxin [Terriglobia bacterium]